MNKLTLFLMTAATAVACTSVSDKTTLQGKFTGAEAPEEVSIVIPDIIDTTVALKNGSFKIEVPAAKNVFGRIMMPRNRRGHTCLCPHNPRVSQPCRPPEESRNP